MAKLYGFVQLVSRPTRVTDHSQTLIDHVYSNNINNTLSCNILTVDISDHLATLTTISLGSFSHSTNRSHNSTNCNIETRMFINEANNHGLLKLLVKLLKMSINRCRTQTSNSILVPIGIGYEVGPLGPYGSDLMINDHMIRRSLYDHKCGSKAPARHCNDMSQYICLFSVV